MTLTSESRLERWYSFHLASFPLSRDNHPWNLATLLWGSPGYMEGPCVGVPAPGKVLTDREFPGSPEVRTWGAHY